MNVRILAAALLAITTSSAALATTYSINVPFSGAQEFPPNASTATGTLYGTYDDASFTLTFNLTFSGVASNTVAAHFHAPAPAGANAGVAIGMAGFPLGVPSGMYANSYVLTAVQNGQILAGLWYANIHSNALPGGEIRAQVLFCTGTSHPASVAALDGDMASFTVVPAGAGPFTYQWRRNGVPLANGGTVSGATTATLTITPLALADNGKAYDCIVTNPCGNIASRPAGLAVTQRCRGDFDLSGIKSVGDIFAFLAAYFATCP